MIAAIICSCSNAPELARRAFKDAGVSYWLDVPIYTGKNSLPIFLNDYPETQQFSGIDYLKVSMQSKSSFVYIIGWDDEELMWANIKNAKLEEKLDADAIIKRFA